MRLPSFLQFDCRSPFNQLAAFLLFNQFVIGAIAFLSAPRGWNTTDWHFTRNLFTVYGANDSWEPMTTAINQLAAEPDKPLYSTLVFEEGVKFQYPPMSLPPFQLVSYGVNAVTTDTARGFAAIACVCVVAIGILTAVILARSLERPLTPIMILVGLCAAATFYPLTKGVEIGQIQTWITLAFTAALFLAMTGRMRASGALVGAMCLIKPHYGLFVLWGVLRKEWGFVMSLLAVCIIASLVSVGLYGFNQHFDYLHALSYLSRHGETFFPNQSVNGILNRLVGLANPDVYSNLLFTQHTFPPFNLLVYAGTMLATLAFVATALVASRRAVPLSFGIMMLSITMASPIAWEHHYALILPIYAVAFGAMRDRPVTLRWLAGSYVLTSHLWLVTNIAYDTPANIVQSYLFFGALVLLVLLHWAAAGMTERPWITTTELVRRRLTRDRKML
jgi:alpha-1,2-mannosyltransferase